MAFLSTVKLLLVNFLSVFYQIDPNMVKKVSLNIPDDSYKELASLSDFYKQDVKDVIISILGGVGGHARAIIHLSKEYKVPVELETVISHTFGAGFHSIYSLFDEILENLNVKGLYTLSDLDVNLDENYMFFWYDALVGCDLQIDGFYVTLEPGVKTLTTNSYIEVKKVNNKALGKLKKLVRSIEVPEEFDELEDYNIEIEEAEEFWILKIDCTAESLNYLPTVDGMSKFVERIFKKAGIKYKTAKN
jgi:hypothetical protein